MASTRELLVLGPPAMFKVHDHESQLSSKFKLLKPWEESSQTPLAQFLSARAQNTEAVLVSGVFPLTSAVIAALPSLRLVVTTSAGVNHIDLVECRRRGVAVANAPGIFSDDVADLAVGLLIDVLRKISAGNRFVKCGEWSKLGGCYPLGRKLGGKHVGIVGLGSIGLKVAKRLEAFGCSISYYSKTKKPSVPYTPYSNIHELASSSDILIISCALNEQTRHLIDRDVLLALGKDGVILNIARGPVIDEKELIHCLKNKEIAGAALDVYEHEPYVPKELLELDTVVLSPHAAVCTDESFDDIYKLVCGNLEAFFACKPLLSQVSEDY